jgi:hypothetical protein
VETLESNFLTFLVAMDRKSALFLSIATRNVRKYKSNDDIFINSLLITDQISMGFETLS